MKSLDNHYSDFESEDIVYTVAVVAQLCEREIVKGRKAGAREIYEF